MLLPFGLDVPKLVKAVPDPQTVLPSPACLPVPVVGPHTGKPSEVFHSTHKLLLAINVQELRSLTYSTFAISNINFPPFPSTFAIKIFPVNYCGGFCLGGGGFSILGFLFIGLC